MLLRYIVGRLLDGIRRSSQAADDRFLSHFLGHFPVTWTTTTGGAVGGTSVVMWSWCSDENVETAASECSGYALPVNRGSFHYSGGATEWCEVSSS